MPGIFKYSGVRKSHQSLNEVWQFPIKTPSGKVINPTKGRCWFRNKVEYGQPTKEGFVDLADTYNYLQGYEVKSIKAYSIGKKYYKVVETADTLVIWRDVALGEDDSKAVIEITEKYPEATQIEVNFHFNILALKGKRLQIGKRVLGLNIIHADIFNQ